jgi:hypothetical protein
MSCFNVCVYAFNSYGSVAESRLSLFKRGTGEQYVLSDDPPSRPFHGACEWEWTCAEGHSCNFVQPGSMVCAVPFAFHKLHKSTGYP